MATIVAIPCVLCIRVNSNKKQSKKEKHLKRKALSTKQRIVIQMLPSVPCSLLKKTFSKATSRPQDSHLVLNLMSFLLSDSVSDWSPKQHALCFKSVRQEQQHISGSGK